jgi:hypothetical protein
VRYVGTATGLLTLILDVYTAEVADAVILRPIDAGSSGTAIDGNRRSTATLISEQLLPQLNERAAAA